MGELCFFFSAEFGQGKHLLGREKDKGVKVMMGRQRMQEGVSEGMQAAVGIRTGREDGAGSGETRVQPRVRISASGPPFPE